MKQGAAAQSPHQGGANFQKNLVPRPSANGVEA